MPSKIAIAANAPPLRFKVSARENASDKASYPCTETPPNWVSALLAKPAKMSLPSLVFQAGRHFSDRLNANVFTGTSTRREKAAALAWVIIAMVNPYVENELLWVENPKDQDISRLCSEILGVGGALELLISAGVVDGRTIRKRSTDFDFDANSLGGSSRVFIEAKGTFNGGAASGQRDSFRKKLDTPGIITSIYPRSYGRAVGIIFSIWSKEKEAKRRADVELLDPEHDAEDTFEEAVREVIRFYARALDEVIGKEQGAQLLFAIAESENLFDQGYSVPIDIDSSGRFPIEFHRSTIRLIFPSDQRTYLGSFWESRVVPPLFKEIEDQRYGIAYTGTDRFVYDAIRGRQFKELLAFANKNDRVLHVRQQDFHGHFVLDRYGVLRGWMNRVPDAIDIKIIEEVPEPEESSDSN